MNHFLLGGPFPARRPVERGRAEIRDTARAYAQDKLAPRIIHGFADETTDPEIFREMGALGLSEFGKQEALDLRRDPPGDIRAEAPVSGAAILKARGGFATNRCAIPVADGGWTRVRTAC